MSAVEIVTGLPTTPIGDAEQRCAAELLLRCILDGRATEGALVELRLLRGERVVQDWFSDVREAVAHAQRRAHRWNVYVGCLPRFQRHGGREALRNGARLVWADCDTSAAVWALRRFPVRPTFAIYSGREDAGTPHVHAWWLLRQRLELDAVEHLNQRLVLALGSDRNVCDAPRVLRVPGTLNHKSDVPQPVQCVHVGDDVDVHELAVSLPALPPPRARRAASPLRVASALDAIPPAHYVEYLTGREVAATGKVQCPFHAGGEERTPSLHCYGDADAGWYCFGCETGGDIYTFAGLLWGLDTRTQFVELRMRLEDTFGINSLGAFA